ncbi:MAG: hypothetical protein M3540_00235, partial [Actinomycetota bacterium]|nr:hypothetical protein [Actinomycetota bacterium]
VLLLIGLIIEQGVIANLRWLQRLEYGLILLAGETAAFLSISTSLPNAGGASSVNVGGTLFMTTLLSTLTITALFAAFVLVIAAVVSRGTRNADPGLPANGVGEGRAP